VLTVYPAVSWDPRGRAHKFRPSVCLSVTPVNRSKTVEVRIMQFSPYSSHTRLVLSLVCTLVAFDSVTDTAAMTRYSLFSVHDIDAPLLLCDVTDDVTERRRGRVL